MKRDSCLSILFGISMGFYLVMVVFYVAKPITSVANTLVLDVTNVLYFVLLYGSLFKIVPPILAVLLSIFNGTNLPLSYALVTSLAISMAGSLCLSVTILSDYGKCNRGDSPINPCNDMLYCCVYSAENTTCQDFGPCAPGYPSTYYHLGPNYDFVELAISTVSLMGYEIFMIFIAVAIRQNRITKESRFLKNNISHIQSNVERSGLEKYRRGIVKEIYKLLPTVPKDF